MFYNVWVANFIYFSSIVFGSILLRFRLNSSTDGLSEPCLRTEGHWQVSRGAMYQHECGAVFTFGLED